MLSNAERVGPSAPGGVREYLINFSLARMGVAELVAVEPGPGFRVLSSAISEDGQRATIRAVADPPISPESFDVILLNTTVRGTDTGVTDLVLGDVEIIGIQGTPLDVVPLTIRIAVC